MLPADNLCKQFGPRSGSRFSRSKLFDTLMVLLKEFFKKVDSENNPLTMKKHAKFTQHAKLARCNSIRQLIPSLQYILKTLNIMMVLNCLPDMGLSTVIPPLPSSVFRNSTCIQPYFAIYLISVYYRNLTCFNC